jgi:hypothetical protein
VKIPPRIGRLIRRVPDRRAAVLTGRGPFHLVQQRAERFVGFDLAEAFLDLGLRVGELFLTRRDILDRAGSGLSGGAEPGVDSVVVNHDASLPVSPVAAIRSTAIGGGAGTS